jgi:hypothetical protein
MPGSDYIARLALLVTILAVNAFFADSGIWRRKGTREHGRSLLAHPQSHRGQTQVKYSMPKTSRVLCGGCCSIPPG